MRRWWKNANTCWTLLCPETTKVRKIVVCIVLDKCFPMLLIQCYPLPMTQLLIN
jgi:hypothetical protein